MPDSSVMGGGSSDEEIFFRKKTIQKFVDSDDEGTSRAISPPALEEMQSEEPGSTAKTKQRRRVIRRSASESDEESDQVRNFLNDNVEEEKTDPSERIISRRQKTKSYDEDGSIFNMMKFSRKQKKNVAVSKLEKPPEPKSLFANKELYDAETSEEESKTGEEDNRTDNYSSTQAAADQEDEDHRPKEKVEVHKEENKQNQVKSQSLFANKDLYDAESSEEESRKEDSTLYDADGSADESGPVSSHKIKSKSHREKKKNNNKKGALSEVDTIHSETQRMVRESRVSLPYHRPKQRSLAEFLQRRPSTPSVTKSVRMSVEQLAAMEKQLKERAKQAEEFYKSSSEDENEPKKLDSLGREKNSGKAFDNVSEKDDKESKNSPMLLEVNLDNDHIDSVCNKPAPWVNNENKQEESIEFSLVPTFGNLTAVDNSLDVISSETHSFLKKGDTPEPNDSAVVESLIDKNTNILSPILENNVVSHTSTQNKSVINIEEKNNPFEDTAAVSLKEYDVSESGANAKSSLLENSNTVHEFLENSENVPDALNLSGETSLSQSLDRPKLTSDDGMILSLKLCDNTNESDKLGLGKNNQNNPLPGKEQSMTNEEGSSFFAVDSDKPVAKPEKTNPKLDGINFNSQRTNTEDMILQLSEDLTEDSNMFPGQKSSPKKDDRFSFKRNLSELLWKESWNSPAAKNNGQGNSDTQESNIGGETSVNGAEQAKILLEGDDARSMGLDSLSSTNFGGIDSNHDKSENCIATDASGQQSLRMMLEGEDAVSMASVDEKKTNSSVENDDETKSMFENARSRSDVELPSVVLEGEDARSTLEPLKEKEVLCERKVNQDSILESTDKLTFKSMDKLSKEKRKVLSEIQNQIDNSQENFNGVKNYRSLEKDDSSQDFKRDESSNSLFFSKILCGSVLSEKLNDKSSDSSQRTPTTKFVPRLNGSPNKVIDLDSTPSPCGVLALMNRFLKHSTMKKPKPEPKVVELGIVTAEQGESGSVPEVKKESVSVLLGAEETTQPGAKLQLLKKQLALQMAQQREQEWLRKQQESQMEAKEEKEPDEKSECGLFDDDEEFLEEEMTSSSEEEEEEEEEEERVKSRSKKSRIRSAFVDDEAEVSDEDLEDEREASFEDDENEEIDENEVVDQEENEDDIDENEVEDQQADEETASSINAKEIPSLVDANESTNELKRTRTFDIFASQEIVDKDEDDQSALEDADIPPYQIGGALTPITQPPAEECFVSSITKPPLRPGIPNIKEESSSLLFPVVSSPSPQLIGLCSDTDKPATENTTDKEIEAELLGLCSGKFLTQPVEPSQDGEASQQSQEDGLARSLISESLPDTQPLPDIKTTVKRSLKLLLSSDDEEDDEIISKNSKSRTKKFHKKLEFSDDENDGSEELSEDEDEPTLVEYDSEENEIVVSKSDAKLPLLAKNFFEDEAELSESEWGSADEDEKDLDTLDFEEGDAEKLDEKKLQEQLGKIHMRRLLDDDQQEVKRLQELYLEDGELYSEGGGRQRQFRWKNLSFADDFGEKKPDDDHVCYEDDEEDEQEWRSMRFARESFLQEQKDKVVSVETTEVDFAEKLKLRLGRSQAMSQPCKLQTKRGSFLARSETALARIAQLTRSTSDSGVLAPTNSRNFVFATLSPEKKDEVIAKATKRKVSAPTLPVVKKPRLSEGILDRLAF